MCPTVNFVDLDKTSDTIHCDLLWMVTQQRSIPTKTLWMLHELSAEVVCNFKGTIKMIGQFWCRTRMQPLPDQRSHWINTKNRDVKTPKGLGRWQKQWATKRYFGLIEFSSSQYMAEHQSNPSIVKSTQRVAFSWTPRGTSKETQVRTAEDYEGAWMDTRADGKMG